MKTTIYYFSATGNSLKVAKDLASLLENSVLLSIAAEVDKEEVKPQAGSVCIIYPVYCFGLPNIVVDFCRKLQVEKDTYVSAVATYGGMPGAAMLQLRDILAGRGIELAAGHGIAMPGNYTPLYGAPPAQTQQKMFERQKEAMAAVAASIKDRRQIKLPANNFLLNFVFSTCLYKFSMPHMYKADKKFRVNEKCNGCGICSKVCPVENIVMQDRRPSWQHHCQQCMACLQWCPQEAIEYGKVTVGRARYHHPDFTAKDFMLEKPR